MATINSISIGEMGCFNSFDWSSIENDAQGNPAQFKYLNIIYGRNYSGKTTISRILRSLETKKRPDNFDQCNYEVLVGSNIYNPNNLETVDFDVRVYNKDFVDAHLGFLRDKDNDVTPFAIVGEANVDVVKQIAEIEKKLGDESHADTLFGKLFQAREVEKSAKSDNRAACKEFDDKLRDKATNSKYGIKYNEVYGDATYNITRIKKDLELVGRDIHRYSLIENDALKFTRQALETPLVEIQEVEVTIPSIVERSRVSKELAERKITTSQPIQELLDESLLQSWVKQGRALHEGARTKCAFCHNDLPEDLWEKLDAHFNKESQELDADIISEIGKLEATKLNVRFFSIPQEERFYENNKQYFITASKEIEEIITVYNADVDKIIAQLEARKSSIFTPIKFDEVASKDDCFDEIIENLNETIRTNNSHTDSIGQSKKSAKGSLILNDVATFYRDIDYESCLNNLETKADLEESACRQAQEKQHDLDEQLEALEALKVQLKDETKGADKVNEYLGHHFGHKGIRLEAEQDGGEDDKAFKFRIRRGDKLAYNLSEGECSIIAFCYFMAKLDEPETQGKRLVIYIDDPISSLDSNHIFFIYSLISSRIVGPIGRGANNEKLYRHDQIFISTHNLDFLKYLKQLDVNGNNREQFLVQKESDTKSTILRLPEYLRTYITEFNYLFEQIVKCAEAGQGAPHDTFYNFGNNLRKFLEAYLYYKYPSNSHYNDRLKLFFGTDLEAGMVAGRITNEMSHLGEIFDRGMKPVEVPEIPKLANYVLDKMFDKDPEQFNALLGSVGRPERNVV